MSSLVWSRRTNGGSKFERSWETKNDLDVGNEEGHNGFRCYEFRCYE